MVSLSDQVKLIDLKLDEFYINTPTASREMVNHLHRGLERFST